MRPLVALERFLERLFERPSARLFRTHVQPAQVRARLEREMDDHRRTLGDRVHVPARYAIHLHADDLVTLATPDDFLEASLEEAALSHARARHYTVAARPAIALVADPGVPRGEVRVIARAEVRPPADRAAAGAPEAGFGGAAAPLRTDSVGIGDHLELERTLVFAAPDPYGPRLTLRIAEPTGEERRVTFDGRPLVAGREPDCDIVLLDPRVSRHHARFQGRAGAVVLTDLGSRNGTTVNSLPVTEVVLGDTDTIRFGDTVLVVEAEGGPWTAT